MELPARVDGHAGSPAPVARAARGPLRKERNCGAEALDGKR